MAKLLSYYQGRDTKKPSGGYRVRPYKVKRKALGGGPFTATKISESDNRMITRVYGGNIKVRLLNVKYANLYIPSERKAIKVEIKSVINTPANKEYAKRGVIVKGTVIETEKGRAIVTSRPGQDGVVNAILIEEKR